MNGTRHAASIAASLSRIARTRAGLAQLGPTGDAAHWQPNRDRDSEDDRRAMSHGEAKGRVK